MNKIINKLEHTCSIFFTSTCLEAYHYRLDVSVIPFLTTLRLLLHVNGTYPAASVITMRYRISTYAAF